MSNVRLVFSPHWTDASGLPGGGSGRAIYLPVESAQAGLGGPAVWAEHSSDLELRPCGWASGWGVLPTPHRGLLLTAPHRLKGVWGSTLP